MSTKRLGTWLAAVVVFGGLVVVGGLSWEGWDGRFPERSDPRLLAEGTIGGAKWSVVQVDERGHGDCLYLRQDGALVERSCTASGVLLDYQVSVRTLRGATGPIIFAVLPPGAAKAEVAADGGDTGARFRTGPLAPLQVRSFGDTGRFVAQPAPPDPGWTSRTSATVLVHDAGGAALTPSGR